jgi:hypothetical protein
MRREKLFWWTPVILTVLSFIITLLFFDSMSFWKNVGEHLVYLLWLYISFMLFYVARSNDRAKKLRRQRID